MSARTWRLLEDGEEYGACEAASAEEALQEAKSNVDASNYDVTSTCWVRVEVVADEDEDYYEERASAKVALHPDEPECSESEHDWQSPHEILGGLAENPGVWGSGGGVVIHEVCMHCGCERVTDTWAQDPVDGEQGLRSVEYEPGKYASEVEAMRDEEGRS